jgi:hypothetical protein
MHFFEFLQLHEDAQLETLWYNGEQVGRRREGEFLILLYQVEGFYVEVFYHTRDKQIKKYVSFECLDKLDPYIADMDISPVYKYMKRKTKKREIDFIGEVMGMAFSPEPEEAVIQRRSRLEQKKPTFWQKLIAYFRK